MHWFVTVAIGVIFHLSIVGYICSPQQSINAGNEKAAIILAVASCKEAYRKPPVLLICRGLMQEVSHLAQHCMDIQKMIRDTTSWAKFHEVQLAAGA